jgi:hypothetical protein
MPELKPPVCEICRDAGFLRGPGPMGTTVRCVCNPAPAPEVDDAPVPTVRQRRGRTYADRLDS